MGRVQKKNSGIFHKGWGGGGWGGGGSAPDFPLKKLNKKRWILPIDHFKTHLFFSILKLCTETI